MGLPFVVLGIIWMGDPDTMALGVVFLFLGFGMMSQSSRRRRRY